MADINALVASLFDDAGEEAREEKLYYLKECYEWLCERTDSPIERLLGAHLLLITDGYDRVDFRRNLLSPYPPSEHTVFASQVDVGRYCADFLFRCWGCCYIKDKDKFADLVVECDGHDFHERTKEQARHDRRRDRWMGQHGIVVMRFTGSEIVKDARACAEEVENRLSTLAEEVADRRG